MSNHSLHLPSALQGAGQVQLNRQAELKISEFHLYGGLHNTAQIILAILGLIGVGWFILGRLFTPDQQKARHARLARIALFLGLASWLGLVLLRQDIVAATGLVIAMLLFWGYFKAKE